MFTIESKYGNDGYAFWFKLLELLGSTEHHYLDCNDSQVFEYMLAKTRLNEDIATEILTMCAKLNAIDPDLWRIRIIRSNNFIRNLDDVYKRRGVNVISNDELMDYCKQKYQLNGIYVNINPQSKVKESKVKESKEEKSKEEKSKIFFPFLSETFLDKWNTWKDYRKKEHKFKYASDISEQAALNKLASMAGNSEQAALDIIEQSIANGWQGLFELRSAQKTESKGMTPYDYAMMG